MSRQIDTRLFLITLAVLVTLSSLLAVFLAFGGIWAPPTSFSTLGGNVTLSVNTSTVITLKISSVAFGVLLPNATDDTTDNDPKPFVVRNDGNVNVDIDIRMNQSMFSGSGSGNNSDTFQFKAGNCSVATCGALEPDAFDWANSTTTWTNFSTSDKEVINSLKFQSGADEAESEVRIHVPLDEIAGIKGSTITFIAHQET